MGTQGEFFETQTAHPISVEDHTVEFTQSSPMLSESEPVISENTPVPEAKPARKQVKDLSIPKLYYSISEVSRLTGLEAYVLRYWETEFEGLSPQKNRAGNRIYSNRDIKLILRIRELLREQRYTIEGAKVILRNERFTEGKTPEEVASVKDPDQISLPTDKPPAPAASITQEEIRAMKQALLDLRAVLRK